MISRYVDRHRVREHRCAGVRRIIGITVEALDIDAAAGKELRYLVDQAGLIHCQGIDMVIEQVALFVKLELLQ